MTIKLTGSKGIYSVIDTDRTDGKSHGQVERIAYPVSDRRGGVDLVTRWEARRPHEILINQAYGFPTFRTRAEAVHYLAGLMPE